MAYQQEIEGFSDLQLQVNAQLGQVSMTLRQLLDLSPDMTIKLAKPAGDNCELLVDGKLLCSGEIIIVSDVFGVRITDFREEL